MTAAATHQLLAQVLAVGRRARILTGSSTNPNPVRCCLCRQWIGPRRGWLGYVPGKSTSPNHWLTRHAPKCPPAPAQQKPRPARDTQRSRVYRADWSMPDQDVDVFGSVAATQAWVDEVIDRPWFRQLFPLPGGVLVGPGRSGATSWTGEFLNRITVGRGSRNPITMLHELAHQVVCRTFPQGELLAGHGPQFAAVYLYLVEQVLGAETAAQLRRAFLEYRVRYRSELLTVLTGLTPTRTGKV